MGVGFVVSFVRSFFSDRSHEFCRGGGGAKKKRKKKNRRDEDGHGIPNEYSFSARRFSFQRSFVTVALISRKYGDIGGCTSGVALHSPSLAR